MAIVLGLWSYEAGRFYVRPDFRFDSILIGGCVVLFLFKSDVSSHKHRALLKLAHPVWLYPCLLAWTIYAANWRWARPFYLTIQTALASGALFWLAASSRGFVFNLFSQGWLRQLGKLSYSIYLWQQLFLFTKVPHWGWLRMFPVNLLMSIIAGVGSYCIVERPFLNLKDRLRRGRSRSLVLTAHGMPLTEPASESNNF